MLLGYFYLFDFICLFFLFGSLCLSFTSEIVVWRDLLRRRE